MANTAEPKYPKFTKTYHVLKEQIPAFLDEDGSNLEDILTVYYEWLEGTVTNGIDYTLKDIDETDEKFVPAFVEDFVHFAKYFEAGIDDQRRIVKYVKQLYEKKGTVRSFELFFRLFFKQDPRIYLPAQDVISSSSVDYNYVNRIAFNVKNTDYDNTNLTQELKNIFVNGKKLSILKTVKNENILYVYFKNKVGNVFPYNPITKKGGTFGLFQFENKRISIPVSPSTNGFNSKSVNGIHGSNLLDPIKILPLQDNQDTNDAFYQVRNMSRGPIDQLVIFDSGLGYKTGDSITFYEDKREFPIILRADAVYGFINGIKSPGQESFIDVKRVTDPRLAARVNLPKNIPNRTPFQETPFLRTSFKNKEGEELFSVSGTGLKIVPILKTAGVITELDPVDFGTGLNQENSVLRNTFTATVSNPEIIGGSPLVEIYFWNINLNNKLGGWDKSGYGGIIVNSSESKGRITVEWIPYQKSSNKKELLPVPKGRFKDTDILKLVVLEKQFGTVINSEFNYCTDIQVSPFVPTSFYYSGVSSVKRIDSNDRQILSSYSARIMDKQIYHPYSYVVESKISADTWEKMFRESVHPAGFSLTPQLNTYNEENLPANITIARSINDEMINGVFIKENNSYSWPNRTLNGVEDPNRIFRLGDNSITSPISRVYKDFIPGFETDSSNGLQYSDAFLLELNDETNSERTVFDIDYHSYFWKTLLEEDVSKRFSYKKPIIELTKAERDSPELAEVPSGHSLEGFGSIITSGSLTVGKTYLIVSYKAGDDFSNIGGPGPDASDDFYNEYTFTVNSTGIPAEWSGLTELVETITTGPLIKNKTYKIVNYNKNDNFFNVGGPAASSFENDHNGKIFVAKGTVPTLWTGPGPSILSLQNLVTAFPLISGSYYRIFDYKAGDDFSQVGGPGPAAQDGYWNGTLFKATIVSSSGWTNGSKLLTIDTSGSINSGLLTIGETYFIHSYIAGDKFSNVGGPVSSNLNGTLNGKIFRATGTTPTVWTGQSILIPLLTSGTLIINEYYRIEEYNENDEFSNVGASENSTGIMFKAIDTTPDYWEGPGPSALLIYNSVTSSRSVSTTSTDKEYWYSGWAKHSEDLYDKRNSFETFKDPEANVSLIYSNQTTYSGLKLTRDNVVFPNGNTSIRSRTIKKSENGEYSIFGTFDNYGFPADQRKTNPNKKEFEEIDLCPDANPYNSENNISPNLDSSRSSLMPNSQIQLLNGSFDYSIVSELNDTSRLDFDVNQNFILPVEYAEFTENGVQNLDEYIYWDANANDPELNNDVPPVDPDTKYFVTKYGRRNLSGGIYGNHKYLTGGNVTTDAPVPINPVLPSFSIQMNENGTYSISLIDSGNYLFSTGDTITIDGSLFFDISGQSVTNDLVLTIEGDSKVTSISNKILTSSILADAEKSSGNFYKEYPITTSEIENVYIANSPSSLVLTGVTGGTQYPTIEISYRFDGLARFKLLSPGNFIFSNGDTIRILGTLFANMGGTTPANDIVLTIVGATGPITQTMIDAATVSSYTPPSGTPPTFSIRVAFNGNYYIVPPATVLDRGTFYYAYSPNLNANRFRILGTLFASDRNTTSPENDINVLITKESVRAGLTKNLDPTVLGGSYKSGKIPGLTASNYIASSNITTDALPIPMSPVLPKILVKLTYGGKCILDLKDPGNYSYSSGDSIFIEGSLFSDVGGTNAINSITITLGTITPGTLTQGMLDDAEVDYSMTGISDGTEQNYFYGMTLYYDDYTWKVINENNKRRVYLDSFWDYEPKGYETGIKEYSTAYKDYLAFGPYLKTVYTASGSNITLQTESGGSTNPTIQISYFYDGSYILDMVAPGDYEFTTGDKITIKGSLFYNRNGVTPENDIIITIQGNDTESTVTDSLLTQEILNNADSTSLRNLINISKAPKLNVRVYNEDPAVFDVTVIDAGQFRYVTGSQFVIMGSLFDDRGGLDNVDNITVTLGTVIGNSVLTDPLLAAATYSPTSTIVKSYVEVVTDDAPPMSPVVPEIKILLDHYGKYSLEFVSAGNYSYSTEDVITIKGSLFSDRGGQDGIDDIEIVLDKGNITSNPGQPLTQNIILNSSRSGGYENGGEFKVQGTPTLEPINFYIDNSKVVTSYQAISNSDMYRSYLISTSDHMTISGASGTVLPKIYIRYNFDNTFAYSLISAGNYKFSNGDTITIKGGVFSNVGGSTPTNNIVITLSGITGSRVITDADLQAAAKVQATPFTNTPPDINISVFHDEETPPRIYPFIGTIGDFTFSTGDKIVIKGSVFTHIEGTSPVNDFIMTIGDDNAGNLLTDSLLSQTIINRADKTTRDNRPLGWGLYNAPKFRVVYSQDNITPYQLYLDNPGDYKYVTGTSNKIIILGSSFSEIGGIDNTNNIVLSSIGSGLTVDGYLTQTAVNNSTKTHTAIHIPNDIAEFVVNVSYDGSYDIKLNWTDYPSTAAGTYLYSTGDSFKILGTEFTDRGGITPGNDITVIIPENIENELLSDSLIAKSRKFGSIDGYKKVSYLTTPEDYVSVVATVPGTELPQIKVTINYPGDSLQFALIYAGDYEFDTGDTITISGDLFADRGWSSPTNDITLTIDPISGPSPLDPVIIQYGVTPSGVFTGLGAYSLQVTEEFVGTDSVDIDTATLPLYPTLPLIRVDFDTDGNISLSFDDDVNDPGNYLFSTGQKIRIRGDAFVGIYGKTPLNDITIEINGDGVDPTISREKLTDAILAEATITGGFLTPVVYETGVPVSTTASPAGTELPTFRINFDERGHYEIIMVTPGDYNFNTNDTITIPASLFSHLASDDETYLEPWLSPDYDIVLTVGVTEFGSRTLTSSILQNSIFSGSLSTEFALNAGGETTQEIKLSSIDKTENKPSVYFRYSSDSENSDSFVDLDSLQVYKKDDSWYSDREENNLSALINISYDLINDPEEYEIMPESYKYNFDFLRLDDHKKERYQSLIYAPGTPYKRRPRKYEVIVKKEEDLKDALKGNLVYSDKFLDKVVTYTGIEAFNRIWKI